MRRWTKALNFVAVLGLCLLVTGHAAFAMGGRPHKHKSQVWVGPYLYSWSELAEWYSVDIDGVQHVFQANADAELVADLQPLGLGAGYHYVTVTPQNIYGSAPAVRFILDMEPKGKTTAQWEIVLLQELLDEPGYEESFSDDLLVVVFKR